jgi:hypothetical protein
MVTDERGLELAVLREDLQESIFFVTASSLPRGGS